MEKYENQREQHVKNGGITNIFPTELGYHSFINHKEICIYIKISMDIALPQSDDTPTKAGGIER